MAGARWTAFAVIGTIVFGAAGCGDEERSGGTTVAIVTAGARDDPDWSTQTANGAVKAARKLRLGSEVVEPADDAAARRALARLAPDAQILIAPYAGDRAAATRVAASQEVPTLLWGDPDGLRSDLVGDAEVAWEQGAWVAGWMAARASRERSVGIVLCDDGTAEMPDRFEIAAAYVAGARAQEPRAKAAYVICGADEASAALATRELVSRGTQMILGACGPSVSGVVKGIEKVIKRTETGETQLVGLVGEKTELNRENIMLTSVMVNPAVAFEQALRDIRAERFGTRVYTLDLENGGITLLQTGRTPQDAYEMALEAGEQFADDAIELPKATNEEELDAVIAESGRDR